MKLKQWLPEQLSQDIFNKKYRYEDETMEDWFNRVSGGNKKVRDMIINKRFIFAGRILANRGLHKFGKKVTYSNCYVLPPPEDNLESIFDTAKEMAKTFSYGGGVGIDISKLSPKGTKINNAAKVTSGSVSFMDLYAQTGELIGQNGRRGATMISINCNHPDILDFINAKSNVDKINSANISIRVNDKFMQAAEDDEANYELKYTREATGEVISTIVNPKEILDLIAYNSWCTGEPSLLYWDTITEWNLFSEDETIEYAGVNPCAEEPLPAYGSCLLGSLNLSAYVVSPFTEHADFNFSQFSEDIITAVGGLNEVLHEGIPLHPLEQQKVVANDLRQIGLGCFGWHDALIKLGYTYGDESSLLLGDKLANILIDKALRASADLTDIYGTYPGYNAEQILKSPFLDCNVTSGTYDLIEDKGLANSQLLTIPPSGSIATMLGVSHALEPMFARSYTRKTESLNGETKYYEVNTPIVTEYMNKFGLKSLDDLPSYFNDTMQISPNSRIKMLSCWQKCIDASISATINVPEEFTAKQIAQLYTDAWKYDLKGVTVFRDNCQRTGVLTKIESEEDITKITKNDVKITSIPISVIDDQLKRGQIIKAPNESIGKTYKIVTGCGNAYLTASWDDEGNIMQTFTNKGSSGTCRSNQEAVSRLISLALRGGVLIGDIIDQLKSVDICPSYIVAKAKGKKITQGSSCPYAMAIILEKAIKEGREIFQDQIITEKDNDNIDIKGQAEIQIPEGSCPECGIQLVVQAGCMTCRNCGYEVCN